MEILCPCKGAVISEALQRIEEVLQVPKDLWLTSSPRGSKVWVIGADGSDYSRAIDRIREAVRWVGEGGGRRAVIAVPSEALALVGSPFVGLLPSLSRVPGLGWFSYRDSAQFVNALLPYVREEVGEAPPGGEGKSGLGGGTT